MTDSILYIGSIINPKIKARYDLEYYSRAGNNKKRGIIKSIESCDTKVTIISPIFMNNNTARYYSPNMVEDDELDKELHLPAIIDIYGVNYIFLFITTTLLSLKLLYKKEFDAIIFYDFKLETAIPALIGSLLFSVPMILEYEDGLFLHDNIVIRWTAKVLRPICGRSIDGAICVNQPLAKLVPTDNTAIVRGFPSIGMPDELPSPEYNQDNFVVMFAGRFDEVRGIGRFLDITPKLKSEKEKLKFWISGYGTDDELDRVKTRVDEINDGRFSYFGTLSWEEYRKRVVSADILVNFQDPHHQISKYTFPSKLLDFMSTGSIIVSTNMSDLDQHFSDKIIVGGTSEQQLLNTLEATINNIDSDQIQQRRERSRKWIKTECSHARVGEKILDLIDE